MFIYLLSTKIF